MIVIDLLYFIFLVLTIPVWCRYLFRKKYRRIIKARFSPDLAPGGKPCIWIHAVSVGEAQSLKSLIRELAEVHRQRVVLTVTTPSGLAFAQREYPNIRVIPAPLDFSFVIRRFTSALNPQVILFNELELWPNWITLAKNLHIPMLLINGRISEIAFKKYALFSHLVGRFLNRLDVLVVQTEMYKKRFLHLKIPGERVIVCGNIKADEAINRARTLPPRESIARDLGLGTPVKLIAVIASSHPSDEQIVIPQLPRLAPRFRFLIAPRHPERAPQIRSEVEKLGLPVRLLSQGPAAEGEEGVLLIDRLGILFNILSLADVVVMGGTWDRRIGGHNLYEPAILGKWIIGGPEVQNFPDIAAALKKGGVYRQVNSGDELARALADIDQIDRERIGLAAIKEVQKRQGSVPCIIEQIQRFVPL